MEKKTLDATKIRKFKKILTRFISEGCMRALPWRATRDPYKITVSELMLQQTQVSRVIPKYRAFLRQFPTIAALARAPQKDVLIAWSGLGYNRRAKFLHQMARLIEEKYNGVFPKDLSEIRSLPGIGPYTARAIFAFAYNKPSIFIETNIRSVFIHHFFPDKELVPDSDIFPYIEATLDQKNPRIWYWTLMDYGTVLKAQGVKAHRKSAGYKKQSPFYGSRRQLRGELIKILANHSLSLSVLQTILHRTKKEIASVLEDLISEKLIVEKKGVYALKD